MKEVVSARDAFRVIDLTVVLGQRRVLEELSLSLSLGESLCIMGPSGCGKTALLRSIARLLVARRGVLIVNDVTYQLAAPIAPEEMHVFYPTVSYVPQTLALWPHLTNFENIMLAPAEKKQSAQRAQELAAALGIEEVLPRRPHACSQGQRQRVALIRALVLSPLLLLVDEVTSALDRDTSQRVVGVLGQAQAPGVTVVAVTHDIRFASSLGSRLVEMDLHGRLSAAGTGIDVAR